MSANILPDDIVHTILLLLPIKCLLRLKTVCSSWNSLISNDVFVINHLQRSRKFGQQDVFLWKSTKSRRDHNNKAYRLVKTENSKLQVEPVRLNSYPGDLLCYVDGIVLLLTMSLKPDFCWLWNPCAKKQIMIPWPHRFNLDSTAFGMCNGPTMHDFKIVARCSGYYSVFSCQNRVWTEKKKFPYDTNGLVTKGLSVGGFCFWAWTEVGSKKLEIFCFDPKDETFRKLQKPIQVMGGFSLTNLKSCLCLYENKNTGTLRCRVWITKDHVNVDSNSWTELIIISLEDVIHGDFPSKCITPLFFTEENELVLCSGDKEITLGIYNPVNKRFAKIHAPASLFDYSKIVSFQNSLFFPA